jgi:hypothetical protein
MRSRWASRTAAAATTTCGCQDTSSSSTGEGPAWKLLRVAQMTVEWFDGYMRHMLVGHMWFDTAAASAALLHLLLQERQHDVPPQANRQRIRGKQALFTSELMHPVQHCPSWYS